jgi:hypothetical protein
MTHIARFGLFIAYNLNSSRWILALFDRNDYYEVLNESYSD